MLSGSIIKAAMRSGHLQAALNRSLGSIGTHFLERAYSQENELRADTLAVRLAITAGYDSGGAINLFLHLDSIDKKSTLGRYFSTHPSFKIRIQNIRNIRKAIVS
jgi:predicted Zn-dependent protease